MIQSTQIKSLHIKMGVEEARAALRSEFPKLDAEDFKNAAGNRDALAKTVAEKMGISEADAKAKIDEIFAANQ
ncbi:hypothetical protein PMZ80_003625 [Knufia obscura]|uniref:Uncharacterized protein n=1 Tax=Knufia obscura TaxID=1635080 RepID=A0ABR0RVU1_9EURO|nr:hypothetical protein PMZ80_003625 [Knufia obscura]